MLGKSGSYAFIAILFIGAATARAEVRIGTLSLGLVHRAAQGEAFISDDAVVVEVDPAAGERIPALDLIFREISSQVPEGKLPILCVAPAADDCDAEALAAEKATGREVEVLPLPVSDVVPPAPPPPPPSTPDPATLKKNFRDRVYYAFQRMAVSGGVAGSVVAIVKGAPDLRAVAVGLAAGVWSFSMQMVNQMRFQWQRNPRMFALALKPGEKEAGAVTQLGKRAVQSFAYALILNGLFHALKLASGDFFSTANALTFLGAGAGATVLQAPWDMWNKERTQRMEAELRAKIHDPGKLAEALSHLKKTSDSITRTQSILSVLLGAVVAGGGVVGAIANGVQVLVGLAGLEAWRRENPKKAVTWVREIASAPVNGCIALFRSVSSFLPGGK